MREVIAVPGTGMQGFTFSSQEVIGAPRPHSQSVTCDGWVPKDGHPLGGGFNLYILGNQLSRVQGLYSLFGLTSQKPPTTTTSQRFG